MKKKLVSALGASLASIALITLAAAPAQAAPWPSNGDFDISGTMGGGARWNLGEYGIHNATNIPDTMNHALYYPNEIYGGSDYFYCGSSSGDGSDSTVTNETNGDVTIDCQPETDAVAPGIKGTLHFRLYAESASGYLARQWLEIENTSGTSVDLTSNPISNYYYWNYYGWTSGDPWETNQGPFDHARDGDVWGAGASANGDEIATSAAWGDPCHSSEYVNGYPQMEFPASVNTIAPGQVINLVTFINMVFPATNDAAGAAAAYATALDQAKTEFAAGLTGRLADGLPAGMVPLGWDTSACPTTPELPNTGVDAGSLGVTGVAAVGLLVAGCAALVVRRRVL